MMKIIKQIVARTWPFAAGMAVFMIVAIMKGDRVGIIPLYVVVPIFGFWDHLLVPEWVFGMTASVLLLGVHVAWPRWYTAILSAVGGYVWCYLGMLVTGESC